MAERVSKYPELPARDLKGLSERTAPTNYPAGVFDLVRGLYPARNGLLQRIPPHSLLTTYTGRILQIHPTGNTNSDVIVQTTTGIFASTLDEIFARETTPSITYPPLTEEDSMSMAIIVQREANAVTGGSIQGYISGTDSSSVVNTMYGRRLTNMLCNESTGGVLTVDTFTASTGGAGAASTPGRFTLTPGTYRISGKFRFFSASANTTFICGLYNFTTSAFECHYDGTTVSAIPILASVGNSNAGSMNADSSFEANVLVATTNKTFQIMQECSVQAAARSLNCGGAFNALSTANVNLAAATLEYASIRILRTA